MSTSRPTPPPKAVFHDGSPGTDRLHVLVVDDDWSMGAVCADMLTHAGFEVSGAENGDQAWETLRSAHYHLVITDYLMPKVSGLDLARRMRVAGMMQPVILISGNPEIQRQVCDPRDPIDVILPKPFSFYELMNRINAALHLAPRSAVGV
jgi:DNA-binding response OmpR family regulator